MSHRLPAARSAAIARCAATAALTAAVAAPSAAHATRPRTGHAAHGARATAHAAVHAHASRAEARAHLHATHAHAHSTHLREAHLHAAHLHAAHLRAGHLTSHARRLAARERSEARASVPVVPMVPTIDLAIAAASMGTPTAAPAVPTGDTLAGRSGKLRARFIVASAAVAGAARSLTAYFPYLRHLFGDSAASATPGVYAAPAVAGHPTFAFITMLPFSQKVAGRVGEYRMGFWPGETSSRVGGAYGNPAGFIEVTADNQTTYVSEHFRLADFLTHDQQDVWPKYLVLREPLLDKLELVLDDLRAHGYRADRLHVMSGFRTPQYNETGGDPSGRAERSRHQYGDAADVWVENGTGMMADLNGDGRIDAQDAAVLAAAAERVEQAHPELVGGIGIYHGNGAHGPFVHIDTRGARARWGHA